MIVWIRDEEFCHIEDIKIMVAANKGILLISDRINGLYIYEVAILVPNYNFITFSISDDEKHLTMEESYKFVLIQCLLF